MTLICSASGVHPSPSFRWTRQGSGDVIYVGAYYKFRPKPVTDDGLMFQCQAQNTVSGVTRSATFIVHFNYPPAADPVITNNSTDGNLYQGDNVIFVCTVTGGKPVNATTVTLICLGRQGTRDTTGWSGVSSSVTFNPVSESDHNSSCTCNTAWKQTDWYTRSVRTTLVVNTPPSSPNITVISGDYPPIAGETVGITLTCVSLILGRPAASYTWFDIGGGQPGVDSQGRGTLTFGPMGRESDGKKVSCRASNRYTNNRRPVAYGTFTLNVFYRPVITLSPRQDSACHPTTSSTCEVIEGQTVSILCSAVSNPAPATFIWQRDDDAYNQFPVGSVFNIAATNRTIHNGKYNCTVTTGSLGDGRPPLTSSQQLTVLVKYKPSRSQLTINTRYNITVNEADDVDFACLADGRPKPYMELRNEAGLVGRFPGGDIDLDDGDTWLNRSLNAQCQHTGVYRCAARNSVGERAADTAILYVNCMPRRDATAPVPEVTFQGAPAQLLFHVVAHPAPHSFSFTYLGKDADSRAGNSSMMRKDILSASCRPTVSVYQATCSITVDNVTEADAGYYTLTVANAFGSLEVTFRLRFSAEATGVSSGPIIGGVLAAVAAVVAGVVVVVFFLRRKNALSTSHKKAKQLENNPSLGSRDASDDGSGQKSTTDSSPHAEGAAQPSVYEGLKTSEVGLASPYAPLQHYVNLRQPSDNQASEYEELRMREVGLSSPYAELKVKGKVHVSKDRVYQNSSGTK